MCVRKAKCCSWQMQFDCGNYAVTSERMKQVGMRKVKYCLIADKNLFVELAQRVRKIIQLHGIYFWQW